MEWNHDKESDQIMYNGNCLTIYLLCLPFFYGSDLGVILYLLVLGLLGGLGGQEWPTAVLLTA